MEIQFANTFEHNPLLLHRDGSSPNAAKPKTDDETNNVNGDAVAQSRSISSTESINNQQAILAEQRILEQLRDRDKEVRAHEMAHSAAAGGLSKGGPSFEYQRGPDGQLYAVGGEVQIDTSGVPGDPEATLEKAIQIQQAALAPAEPSAQDRSVAMAAVAMAAQARAEINNRGSSQTDTVDASANAASSPLFAQAHAAYSSVAEIDYSRNTPQINQIA